MKHTCHIPGNDPAACKACKPRAVRAITVARVVAAIKRDNYTGFCLTCGASHGGCEPDAEGYTCEACGKPQVMGAENLLLRIG